MVIGRRVNLAMQSTKSSNPKKIQKKRKSPPRGRKTLYSPEMCEKAKNQMISTGKAEDCYRILNISADTFHRWVKKYPEFSEAIHEGVSFRTKLRERNFSQETQAAFEGLNKTINGYPYEETQTKYEYSLNEESGKMEERVSSKTVHRKYCGPNIQAIKQVLGERDILNTMFLGAIDNFRPDGSNDLYKMLFGSLAVGNDTYHFTGASILNPMVDLIKMRLMESLVQKMFDEDSLPLDKYMEYTCKIRGDYKSISDNMENRAQKLLEGKSYREIIFMIEALFQHWLNILRDVLNENKVTPPDKLENIMVTVVDRINEQRTKESLFTRDLPLP